jgi:hypothetical protein
MAMCWMMKLGAPSARGGTVHPREESARHERPLETHVSLTIAVEQSAEDQLGAFCTFEV